MIVPPLKYNNLLKAVKEVRISVIMDNYTDILMTDTAHAKRYRPDNRLNSEHLPVAEHGFSVIVSIIDDGIEENFLFDTGLNHNSYEHNLDVFDIDLTEVSSIILSHGHFDHVGGLKVIADKLKGQQVKIYFHSDALLERKLILPNKEEIMLPTIDNALVYSEKFDITMVTEPTILYDGRLLISGEIPRITEFENGFPFHYIKRGQEWVSDTQIKDDICIIINVSNKGLVILTGCAHSGLINIIKYAVKLTGINKVYAVLGGFHLSGYLFEKIIPETIAELKKFNPSHIIPCHCTGFAAVHAIAGEFPNSFVLPAVGTKFAFN
ncbi:MBL fold metallo-hydrolase [Candidatus Magnetomonas plexicatena]|uniref:MBL fold metallo-hydrolase n=1 Tax=Candidatus Magnetomonas plexicatena TaxID=2552947 RepID=UPI001100769B|nr:MBL fold metallo-hydrolase [Nitrospirales bacterium LBB_01]